jgi:hypothetical protein
MGLLAHFFPSLFPPTGGDASSARIVWLYVMAGTQIMLGLGYVVQAHVIPFAARLVTADRAVETGTLALPKVRGAVGR